MFEPAEQGTKWLAVRGDQFQVFPADLHSSPIAENDTDPAIPAMGLRHRLQINFDECRTGGSEPASIVVECRDSQPVRIAVISTGLISILVAGDQHPDLCLTPATTSFRSFHSSSEPDSGRSGNQGDGRTLTIVHRDGRWLRNPAQFESEMQAAQETASMMGILGVQQLGRVEGLPPKWDRRVGLVTVVWMLLALAAFASAIVLEYRR